MFRRCVEKTLGSTVDGKNLAKQSTPPLSASKIRILLAAMSHLKLSLELVGGIS